jgi:sarcosine/dimethylglycine N-methyltransferase
MSTNDIQEAAARYRATYDTALSELLSRVWGGNLHMGLFRDAGEPLLEAQMRAKRHMAEAARITAGQEVIEAACGVGGTARFLAATYGARVHATNIAETQLAEGQELTQKAGLSNLIDFRFADYHELPFADASCDVWWCQEALLYSVDKRRVMQEAIRVLRPGGRIIMSDLLLSDRVADEERKRFTATMKAPNMWSMERWDALIAELPVKVLERQDWAPHTILTFQNVLANLEKVAEEFRRRVDPQIVEGSFERLTIQYEAAQAGNLGWCFYALQP